MPTTLAQAGQRRLRAQLVSSQLEDYEVEAATDLEPLSSRQLRSVFDVMDSVKASSWVALRSAQSIAQATTSWLLTTVVPHQIYDTVQTISSYARMHSKDVDTNPWGISLNYSIIVVIEDLGYTDATTAYNAITAKLINTVEKHDGKNCTDALIKQGNKLPYPDKGMFNATTCEAYIVFESHSSKTTHKKHVKPWTIMGLSVRDFAILWSFIGAFVITGFVVWCFIKRCGTSACTCCESCGAASNEDDEDEDGDDDESDRPKKVTKVTKATPVDDDEEEEDEDDDDEAAVKKKKGLFGGVLASIGSPFKSPSKSKKTDVEEDDESKDDEDEEGEDEDEEDTKKKKKPAAAGAGWGKMFSFSTSKKKKKGKGDDDDEDDEEDEDEDDEEEEEEEEEVPASKRKAVAVRKGNTARL
jgi:hypothetical protein